MELTSRLRNTEIPTKLAALEVARDSDKNSAIDVCLASNIIEVGIDVDRLSLLCVVAQPKTTSTYIQVTGRVGRNWKEKPGLVVTIYAADRPRDRSHFEHFRSYHERLYAQVEPTSVTPYSRPLLERALHGVLGAYIRLLGSQPESDSPRPFPEDAYNKFVGRLLGRARRSGFSDEETTISEVARLRMNKWRQKGPAQWIGEEDDCLLQPATGNPLQEQRENPPFATAYSMRNVDAPCELKASDEYMSATAYEAAFEVDDE
jgi:superfamily II DNA/RNA helicase